MTQAQPKFAFVPQILTVFKYVTLTETTGSLARAMTVVQEVVPVLVPVQALAQGLAGAQGLGVEAVLVVATQVLVPVQALAAARDQVVVLERILALRTLGLGVVLGVVPEAARVAVQLELSLKRISLGTQKTTMD